MLVDLSWPELECEGEPLEKSDGLGILLLLLLSAGGESNDQVPF